jgi:hypothetical protein
MLIANPYASFFCTLLTLHWLAVLLQEGKALEEAGSGVWLFRCSGCHKPLQLPDVGCLGHGSGGPRCLFCGPSITGHNKIIVSD